MSQTVRTMLGEWIEREREARRESIEAAAETAGVYVLTLRRAREGGQRLQLRIRERLAEYLRVDAETVAQLFGTPAAEGRAAVGVGRIREGSSLLGERLQLVRQARGETVAEMACVLGVAPATVWRLITVNGEEPRTSTWRAVAAYAGISVEVARSWARLPATGERSLPVQTFVGRKLHPTVPAPDRYKRDGRTGCDRCAFLSGCRVDVLAGDFAWCEEVTAADFDPSGDGETEE